MASTVGNDVSEEQLWDGQGPEGSRPPTAEPPSSQQVSLNLLDGVPLKPKPDAMSQKMSVPTQKSQQGYSSRRALKWLR